MSGQERVYDPQNPPLMGCGHSANGTLKGRDGEPDRPACAICAGIVPGASIVVEKPSLEGRRSRCLYNPTASEVDSAWSLPFFSHRPENPYDEHYCGCMGWD